jgi:hypothetical protein
MAAKTIQLSADGSTNWLTLPGSKGELEYQASDLKDTIFGQEYESGQTGLIGWMANANGVYKGYAGYVAKVLKSGSTTAMTDEAMTLVSGKTYKITNAAKNVWDRTVTPTFEDNAVAISANDIESIDYLFGRVTFTSGYTVTGPITVATGSYLPMAVVAKANSFTLTQTADTKETSDFETAQANGGFRTFEYGLRKVELSTQGTFATSNGFKALLTARSEVVIEINPDGANGSVARGWFKPMNTGQSGDVGALEEETLSFSLAVPYQSDVIAPFAWVHTSSTLSAALQLALSSWANGTECHVRYLSDGTNGQKGEMVITDISLTGGLEAMNDFALKMQGTGAPTNVP